MKIIIIAAISANFIIGNNNNMIWKLPKDLKRFKNLTMGHYIIMGRKTFESIKKPLIGRKNIILTKNSNYFYPGIQIFYSLKLILSHLNKKNIKQVFIIGGGQLYNQAIKIAHTLEITFIHHTFKGDTKFPKIIPHLWQITHKQSFIKDKDHIYNYSFITYNRIYNKITNPAIVAER